MKKIIILLVAIISVSSCKKDKNNPTPKQVSQVNDPAGNGSDGNNGGNNGNGGNATYTVADLQINSNSNVNRPCGLAISKSGIVAVTEYNGFDAYGKKGTTRVWNSYSDMMLNKVPMATWQNVGAEAAVFDEKENLYIAETEQNAGIAIYKRTANGFTYAKTIQGGLNNPRGMAVKDGQLYLADDGNNRVIRYEDPLNSNSYTPVLVHLQGPKAVAIDGNDIYVAEYGLSKVSKYTIGNWDAPTATVTVTKPVDVAVKDGLLVVAQPEAGTIQQYASANPSNDNVKQTVIGGNVFGMAFSTGTVKTLFVANFDNNKITGYLVK